MHETRYPGLCRRAVRMFKCTAIVVDGELQHYLTMDMSVRCAAGGFGFESKSLSVATVTALGLFVVMLPGYYAAFLTFFHRQKTGEVLDDPTKLKEGEQLGEELSKLDSKFMKAAFGFFYRSTHGV